MMTFITKLFLQVHLHTVHLNEPTCIYIYTCTCTCRIIVKKLNIFTYSCTASLILTTMESDLGTFLSTFHSLITAPQHLVCRAVQSLHINHMQTGIIEVFICRRLHMNTSTILICIWLVCRLCTTLHTKCCGAVHVLTQPFHLLYWYPLRGRGRSEVCVGGYIMVQCDPILMVTTN